MKIIILLITTLFLLPEFIQSQSLVGKKVSDVEKEYQVSHVFKIPNATLYRTIFYKLDNNEQPVFRYAYSNPSGIIQIELQKEYVFADQMYYDLDTSMIDSHSNFSEGYAVIKNKETALMGVINTEGKMIIEPQYTFLGKFSEGLAYFADLERCAGGTTLPNKMGYIDIKNKHIIELKPELAELYGCCYFHGGPFRNGIAIMNTREFGFDCNSWALIVIDKTGKVINYDGQLLDVNYKPIKLD